MPREQKIFSLHHLAVHKIPSEVTMEPPAWVSSRVSMHTEIMSLTGTFLLQIVEIYVPYDIN